MSTVSGVPNPPLLLRDNASTASMNAKVDIPRGDVIVYAVNGDVYKTHSNKATGVETTKKLFVNGDDLELDSFTLGSKLIQGEAITPAPSGVSNSTAYDTDIGNVKIREVRTDADVHIRTDVFVESTQYFEVTTVLSFLTQPSMRQGLLTNTIDERSSGSGVTVDGVLLKDGEVSTDTISENTSGSGVTVDSLLIKDGKIQASGVQNNVYCRMRPSSTAALSAGVPTKVPFDVSVADPTGNMANTTSDRVDIPAIGGTTGVFNIQVQLQIQNGTDGDSVRIYLYKNGSPAALSSHSLVSSSYWTTSSFIATAVVNDYFEIYAYNASAGSTAWWGTSYANTYLNVAMMGTYS